jgi:hypothetical protein
MQYVTVGGHIKAEVATAQLAKDAFNNVPNKLLRTKYFILLI